MLRIWDPTGSRSFTPPIFAETGLAPWKSGVQEGNQGWTNEGPREFGWAACQGSGPEECCLSWTQGLIGAWASVQQFQAQAGRGCVCLG